MTILHVFEAASPEVLRRAAELAGLRGRTNRRGSRPRCRTTRPGLPRDDQNAPLVFIGNGATPYVVTEGGGTKTVTIPVALNQASSTQVTDDREVVRLPGSSSRDDRLCRRRSRPPL